MDISEFNRSNDCNGNQGETSKVSGQRRINAKTNSTKYFLFACAILCTCIYIYIFVLIYLRMEMYRGKKKHIHAYFRRFSWDHLGSQLCLCTVHPYICWSEYVLLHYMVVLFQMCHNLAGSPAAVLHPLDNVDCPGFPMTFHSHVSRVLLSPWSQTVSWDHPKSIQTQKKIEQKHFWDHEKTPCRERERDIYIYIVLFIVYRNIVISIFMYILHHVCTYVNIYIYIYVYIYIISNSHDSSTSKGCLS